MAEHLSTPPGERRITDELTVLAPAGAPDLRDPLTGRTVIPEAVTLRLDRFFRLDRTSEVASVTVVGPRRLKSGAVGKRIDSSGWESALNGSWLTGDRVPRPDWLTNLLLGTLPGGWGLGLLDLTCAACGHLVCLEQSPCGALLSVSAVDETRCRCTGTARREVRS
ncbi:hypothetical protein [Streptomyces sp. SBT349]|uniref:hypothetical protein n=1 Tax=Streptomyces sp. SBT349 TaxID=1580539 RepID=UPI00066CF5E9|nr:hypothetical protein [Streptomyces sp. SBT349]